MSDHLQSQFLTTRWTLILNDGHGSSSTTDALATLCETYHTPVYVFIRNRCGNDDDAQDLTQGFFETLIEKRWYQKARPERGRFRAFLLTAVKNYLINAHRQATTCKRGGEMVRTMLENFEAGERADQDQALLTHHPPDAVFDREWAAVIFKRTWSLLRAEYENMGQLDRFKALRATIVNPGAPFPYDEVASQLALSESGAKSAAFRLKTRFRELFRAIVAEVVDHPDEVNQEIEYLIQAMSQNLR